MKIYGDLQSGNCYKVKLLCSLLDLAHQWIEVDILAGDTKKTEFLKKNPNGKIPLLELSDSRYLEEGGFDLTKYSAIQSWIDRIASEPKYVGMD